MLCILSTAVTNASYLNSYICISVFVYRTRTAMFNVRIYVDDACVIRLIFDSSFEICAEWAAMNGFQCEFCIFSLHIYMDMSLSAS